MFLKKKNKSTVSSAVEERAVRSLSAGTPPPTLQPRGGGSGRVVHVVGGERRRLAARSQLPVFGCDGVCISAMT